MSWECFNQVLTASIGTLQLAKANWTWSKLVTNGNEVPRVSSSYNTLFGKFLALAIEARFRDWDIGF
jgi:hypothetical protein